MLKTNRVPPLAKKKAPTVREGIYDLYWVFAHRRQQAFERRFRGEPGPWTSDRIIQEYKFCNVFRAADRVSQYLIREVAYARDESAPEDRLFQILAFRTFSKPETWEGVRERLGEAPTLKHLTSGALECAVDEVKATNGGLYTGAFILCATKAYGFDKKHRNYLGLFRHMFVERKAGARILAMASLADLVEFLGSFPLLGPFMSYQIAIDLNYSDMLQFHENEFTQAGPGALRGIRKAFTDMGEYGPADVIRWMVDNQSREFDRLGLPFKGLFGRPIHAIDAQGLFCELDKYCREAAPHLKSNRTRIKARFNPKVDRIDWFFPPKWGLNQRLGNASGRIP